MNLKKTIFFGLFMVIGLMVKAQTADEIVSKYIEKTGGKDAWSKVTTSKTTAKVKTQGMDFPAIMLSKKMKQKISFTFQGINMVQPAFDGTTGWQTNFMNMKPEKMEAEDTEILRSEVDDFPNPFLNYKQKGYTLELQDAEVVEGTDCFKLKMTKKPIKIDGKDEENASVYLIDKENFIPILIRSVIKKGPAKGKLSEIYFSDYQDVNGLMMPFTIDQKFEAQTQASIVIEKIELNVDIDDKEFAFPEGNQ
jgi:hypothetical protein